MGYARGCFGLRVIIQKLLSHITFSIGPPILQIGRRRPFRRDWHLPNIPIPSYWRDLAYACGNFLPPTCRLYLGDSLDGGGYLGAARAGLIGQRLVQEALGKQDLGALGLAALVGHLWIPSCWCVLGLGLGHLLIILDRLARYHLLPLLATRGWVVHLIGSDLLLGLKAWSRFLELETALEAFIAHDLAGEDAISTG